MKKKKDRLRSMKLGFMPDFCKDQPSSLKSRGIKYMYSSSEVEQKMKEKGDKKLITIRDTGARIFPSHVGITWRVYNGKKYENVVIKNNMVGYIIGEFIQTRKKTKHNMEKKK